MALTMKQHTARVAAARRKVEEILAKQAKRELLDAEYYAEEDAQRHRALWGSDNRSDNRDRPSHWITGGGPVAGATAEEINEVAEYSYIGE